ncbi:acyltransferase [Yersinia entomophaga]|uniref:Acyltransferase n=1 Tax=Yersinia entomophaga TaxID=935293 RepID=A0ABM6BQ68_YERET|nr:glycosyltransferase family 2 protein [Yersinia entomophaga]ANI31761.1 acyltransferase [Yersinia entomophaga]OWF85397.1 acyltransferase [Yersinia entomophaga]
MSLTVHAFAPCVVIPCYNHGAMMNDVLARLAPFGLHCFIIDDGSEPATQQILQQLAGTHSGITLVRLPCNQGKGVAVLTGFTVAAEAGYSHVLQVDADGQHCIEDIPEMLKQSQRYPDMLISGRPIYDQSVPKSRLYGRYITHVWVWIETLSLSLKDSMCGFRVYPLAPVIALMAQYPLGKRMDFDTEIMVRLYWQGIDSRFVPTRVTYPADGLSHFDALRDNLRISWMHTRLFLGMLRRLPQLLTRRRPRHWAGVKERKGLNGMRFMLAVYRLLGRKTFEILLRPVVGYFWLTGRTQRQASQQYLVRLQQTAQKKSLALPGNLTSYRHFLRFSRAMLDKVASWRGDLRLGEQIVFAPGAQETINAESDGGKLILASHLGDIEVCRALAQQDGHRVIHALVFSEHAQRFKQVLEEIAPQAGINLIPVTRMGPETAILLKEKLDAGEWVAIVGDRTSVTTQRGGDRRVVWSEFLGAPAPFPQGPFVLASVLRCPVLLMFALHQQGKLHIHCEPFADPLLLPRQQRETALQQAVDRYASRLEYYALQSPLDWFNFFDFWRLPDSPSGKE